MYIHVQWQFFVLLFVFSIIFTLVGYWARGPIEERKSWSYRIDEDPTPPVFFDEHDLAVIGMYEDNTDIIPVITDAREITWEEKTRADTDAFIAEMITS